MLYRTLILVTLFVYCQGRNVGGPVFRNDYKYYSEANGWFKLHIGPMNWQDARLMCSYEGAVLVSPLNDQIQAGVAKFLRDQNPSSDVFYSGVSSLFGNGLYHSTDGVKLEEMPINWSKNEPSHPEGCLVFYYNNGTMGSQYCFEKFPFVCYKENQNVEMVRNECGTFDNGYKRINGSTECYKYHPEAIDWEEAYKICHAEGARLAIHNQFKKKEYPERNAPVVYVGYKLIGGVWWDITGKRMEPYRTGSFYACGARNWHGEFAKELCTQYFPFLCEKEADHIV